MFQYELHSLLLKNCAKIFCIGVSEKEVNESNFEKRLIIYKQSVLTATEYIRLCQFQLKYFVRILLEMTVASILHSRVVISNQKN